MKRLFVSLLVCVFLVSCAEEATSVPIRGSEPESAPVILLTHTLPAQTAAPLLQPTATKKPKQISPITPQPTRTPTGSPVAPTNEAEANAWKALPVIPETVDTSLQRV